MAGLAITPTPYSQLQGLTHPNPLSVPASSTRPPNQYGNEGAYNAALNTSSRDYDAIMKGYDDILKKSSSTPVTQLRYEALSPTMQFYQQSPELSNAISQLGSLSRSGGLEDSEISAIRARAKSPISSIYENAKRNLDRQKRLSGGYSPSYNATVGRLARESSQQIANVNTDVEGRIAEMIAGNRLAIAPIYANTVASRDAERQRLNELNAAEAARINALNASNSLAYADYNRNAMDTALTSRLRALEGMRGLYGTTPALVNEFGNQVAQAKNQMTREEALRLQKEMGYLSAADSMRGIYG